MTYLKTSLLFLFISCAAPMTQTGRTLSATTMSNLGERELAATIAGKEAKQALDAKLASYWEKLSALLDPDTSRTLREIALQMVQVSTERKRYTEATAILKIDNWIKTAAPQIREEFREQFLREAGPLFDETVR